MSPLLDTGRRALRQKGLLVALMAAACWLALHHHLGSPARTLLGSDARGGAGRAAAAPTAQQLPPRPRRRPRHASAPTADPHRAPPLQSLHLVSSVHAIEVANLAAEQGVEQAWIQHLSFYLDPANETGMHLSDRPGPLLGRLSTRTFPAVDGGPLVSVIMVASNAADTIEYAARSILQQTWTALELIIIDDASSDGTWSVAEALGQSDGRVRLLRNPVRVGPYVSRNRALTTVVSGDYVTTQDADDWAAPRRLQVQVQQLLDSAGAVRGNYLYSMRVRESGFVTMVEPGPASPDGVARQACPSAMYETALLREELGHWDSVLYEADNEMMYRARAFLGAAGFVEIPHVGLLQADRPRSLGKQGYRQRPVDASTGTKTTTSARELYRQAYSTWHAHAQQPGRPLYLAFPLFNRTFPAPEEMAIGTDQVCACLEGTQRACGVSGGGD